MRNLLILLTFLLVGCMTQKEKLSDNTDHDLCCNFDPKLYQIYVDELGNLIDPKTHHVIPSEDEHVYIYNILENVKREDKKTLTIFIHGGLNNFKHSTGRVSKERVNAMLNNGKYPLFISWDSAAFSNYWDHLMHMRNGEYLQDPRGSLSSPFILIEDTLRSLARIPASLYNSVFGLSTVSIEQYTKEEQAAYTSAQEIGCTPGSPNYQFTCHVDGIQTGHTVKDFLTFINPTKLATAPFVDGLGSGSWNSMLRRTDLVLRKKSAFSGETGTSTVVTKFFTRYGDNCNIIGDCREVDLIGHSMGTIVANDILSQYPDINFSHVVYMAAACRVKDLEQSIVPYLSAHGSTKFYNLTLSPYRDLTENTAYDFVPRGSLLIWIDQIFGEPNSFLDRVAGFWFNIMRSAESVFPEKIRSQVHFTRFGVTGGPIKHGDFGDYDFWENKFWEGAPLKTVAEK